MTGPGSRWREGLKLGWWSQPSFHQLPAREQGQSLLWDLSPLGQASHGGQSLGQMSVLFPFLCARVSVVMRVPLCKGSWNEEPLGRALAPQLVWSQPWGSPKVPEGVSLHLFLQDEGEKWEAGCGPSGSVSELGKSAHHLGPIR